MWKESSLHDGPTYALQEWLCAQQPSQMCKRRDCDARAVAFANVMAGLFVQHPIWYCELRTVRQSDLDIVASHDVEPANNDDFFIEVRMEPVVIFASGDLWAV